MSREDNDSIEQFFQKAASRYPAQFNDDDWRNMEKMLEEDAARTAAIQKKWWQWGGASVAVLAMVTIAYLFWSDTPSTPDGVRNDGQAGRITDQPAVAGEHDLPHEGGDRTGTETPENETEPANGQRKEGASSSLTDHNDLPAAQETAGNDGAQHANMLKPEGSVRKETKVGPGTERGKISSGQPAGTPVPLTGPVHTDEGTAEKPVHRPGQEASQGNGMIRGPGRQAPEETVARNEPHAVPRGVDESVAKNAGEPNGGKENGALAPPGELAGKAAAVNAEKTAARHNRDTTGLAAHKTTLPKHDAPNEIQHAERTGLTERSAADTGKLTETTEVNGLNVDTGRQQTRTAQKSDTTALRVYETAVPEERPAGKGALPGAADNDGKNGEQGAMKTTPGATPHGETGYANDRDATSAQGAAGDTTALTAYRAGVAKENDDRKGVLPGNNASPVATGDSRKSRSTGHNDDATAQHGNERIDSVRAVPAAVDSLSDELAEQEQPDTAKGISRLSVSLIAFPDFNRTGQSNYTGTGDAFGLMINYRIFRRWSISTGALRSSKKYWGYGREYNPPEGYWNARTNGVIPEKVEGNCVVLEIPLSLAFDVLSTKRSTVFVSAGVSSYLMFSEYYEYTFKDPDPAWARGWSTDKSSSYAFSIGVVSVGYEYLIRPHVAIGVTPYYKMPFGGIGWADVTLYSTGAYFSVLYRF